MVPLVDGNACNFYNVRSRRRLRAGSISRGFPLLARVSVFQPCSHAGSDPARSKPLRKVPAANPAGRDCIHYSAIINFCFAQLWPRRRAREDAARASEIRELDYASPKSRFSSAFPRLIKLPLSSLRVRLIITRGFAIRDSTDFIDPRRARRESLRLPPSRFRSSSPPPSRVSVNTTNPPAIKHRHDRALPPPFFGVPFPPHPSLTVLCSCPSFSSRLARPPFRPVSLSLSLSRLLSFSPLPILFLFFIFAKPRSYARTRAARMDRTRAGPTTNNKL